MKKFLLSLIALVGLGTFSSTADTTNVTASDISGTTENQQFVDDQEYTTTSGFTFVFNKNNGQTQPQTWTANDQYDVRVYAKGTVKITSANGNMTKAVFNISTQGKKRLTDVTPSEGSCAVDTDAWTVTWTGDASEVTFTVGDKSTYGTDGDTKAGQFDFVSVDITTGGAATPTADAPTFSPESGTEIPADGLAVTITAADGATIYYTLDGTTPTTESDVYSSPILVTKTTTVKAIAAESGKNNSAVATATYKEPVATVANIAAFLEKADTVNEVIIAGPVVVSGDYKLSGGEYLYVQDESGYLLVFDSKSSLPNYDAGAQLSNIAGVYTVYNGTLEMVPTVASFDTNPTVGDKPEPTTSTVASITTDRLNEYVLLSDVTVSTSTENEKDHYATQGDDQVLLYNKFSITFPEDGDGYDVYGYVAQYSGTVQVYPVSVVEHGAEVPTYEAETIAEFLEKADGDTTNVWTITGDVKTVYQNGTSLYIQDINEPYTGLLVYGSLGRTYEPGTIINHIKGNWVDYYYTIEFKAVASSFTEGTAGSAPVATPVDLDLITTDYANCYVELCNVTISDYDSSAKTFTITDEIDNTFTGYNKWSSSVTIPEDDVVYNVFGFINYYQAKDAEAPSLQFYPTAFYGADSVATIDGDNTAAKEYYSIDGVRVANPENGLYIVRQGNTVKKVIIRK